MIRFLILLMLLIASPSLAWLPHGSATPPAPPYAITVTAAIQIRYLDNLSNTNISGDTYNFSAWAPDNSCGQTHCTFGMVNDPQSSWGTGLSGNPNVGFLQLQAINATSPTAVSTNIVLVAGSNTLTGYGAAGSASDCGGNTAWKGSHPFYLNGLLYINMYRLSNSPPFYNCASTLIVSPDNGTHWCNPNTTINNGGVCNSSAPWSATGDVPASLTSAYMLWLGSGVNDNTHPMNMISPIINCQDGQTCPAISGCDPIYFCVYSQDGQFVSTYLARIAKTANPLVAANWSYWTGGDVTNNANWSSSISASAVVTTRAGFGYMISAMWLSDFSALVLCGTDDVHIVCQSGASSAGPFSTPSIITTPLACPNGEPYQPAQFPTFINYTLATVSSSPPHDTVLVATNGSYSAYSGTQANNCYSPYFIKLNFVKQ